MDRDLRGALIALGERRRAAADFAARHHKVLGELRALEGAAAKAEADFKAAVRTTGLKRLAGDGFRVTVAYPTSERVDADALVRAWPGAAQVPGLLVRQVDVKEFDRQRTLGRVPEAAILAAVTEVPATPRVTIKDDAGAFLEPDDWKDDGPGIALPDA